MHCHSAKAEIQQAKWFRSSRIFLLCQSPWNHDLGQNTSAHKPSHNESLSKSFTYKTPFAANYEAGIY